MTIRAIARIAGHRRLTRSRTRWTIWRNTVSALPDHRSRPIGMVVLSAIVRGKRKLQHEPLDLGENYGFGQLAAWVQPHALVNPDNWISLASRIETELADYYSDPHAAEPFEPKAFRPWGRKTARDISQQLTRLGGQVSASPRGRLPYL